MKHYIRLSIFTFLLSLSCFATVFGQKSTIYGIVTNEKDELLVGASVYWKDRSAGTNTDIEGAFNLPARTRPDSLVVQYVGYSNVTIEVLPGEDSLWVVIQGITALKGVDIVEQRFGNSVSTLDPRNIESISSKELKKAPCLFTETMFGGLQKSFHENVELHLATI